MLEKNSALVVEVKRNTKMNKTNNSTYNVYVISNIHPSRYDVINELCEDLDYRFNLFNPHINNEYNLDNSKIEFKVFEKDKLEIDKADISLVLMPLFGRDCAAEIGYSYAIGNTVIAYVSEMNSKQDKDWLNDWMVKGFINYIVTLNKEVYELLRKDVLLNGKENRDGENVFLIEKKELSDVIERLHLDKIERKYK